MESLINRAKRIVLQPNVAWEIIKTEKVSVTELLTTYILPLAIIPAVASFIGYGFIGLNAGILGQSASLVWGINQAVTIFFSTFIGILGGAWIIRQLAPNFGVTVSIENAVKLVGYSYTPLLLAGIFYIIPALAVFVVIGSLYCLYVLYLGFQPITNVGDDQRTGYFLLSLIAVIALFMAISFVLKVIMTMFGLAGLPAAGL